MSKKTLFRVVFMSQGKVYEIYAREVGHGDMFGFIEVEQMVFGERSSVVVDPSEEKINASTKWRNRARARSRTSRETSLSSQCRSIRRGIRTSRRSGFSRERLRAGHLSQSWLAALRFTSLDKHPAHRRLQLGITPV
jgi:hypothetical protein